MVREYRTPLKALLAMCRQECTGKSLNGRYESGEPIPESEYRIWVKACRDYECPAWKYREGRLNKGRSMEELVAKQQAWLGEEN